MSESDERQASPAGAIADSQKTATVTLEVPRDVGARPTGPEGVRLTRPPEGAQVPPVDVFRLRVRPERPDVLELLGVPQAPGGLVVGEGALGEAEVCLARGDTDGARKLAADLGGEQDGPAGELSDEEACARTISVRAHLMDGNLEAARAVMGRAGIDARLGLADAALALAEGDVARARERTLKALEHNPRGVAEHYTLALIHVAVGEAEQAIDELAKVAASVPEHAVARHQLGQLTLAAGDPARAGTLFEMAVQLAPTFVPPALSLAEMLVDSRQYGEAMALLTDVTERLPNALSPRLLQLRVLVEIGERGSAAGLAEALKSAAPDHPEVTALWAEAMLLDERGDDAQRELERLLPNAVPDERARLLRILARVCLQRSPPRAHDALAHLREAVDIALAPGELRLELAQLNLSLGEPDDAATVLEEIGADPRSDLGDLLSGAVMARNHGLWGCARRLGEAARGRVQQSPAEAQISAFLASLPPLD